MVVSWDDRQGEINTWIEGLNQVVARASDNQLDSLDRLLEGHGTMLAPNLDGSFDTLHRESLKTPIFFVTAIFPGDEVCGESWAWPFSKEKAFAFHLPNSIGFSAMNSAGRVVREVRCGLIILRGTSVVTPLWKGLCFAHELLHRQNAFKYHPDLMRTRRVTGVEERDVHSFIHRLMVLLGG